MFGSYLNTPMNEDTDNYFQHTTEWTQTEWRDYEQEDGLPRWSEDNCH